MQYVIIQNPTMKAITTVVIISLLAALALYTLPQSASQLQAEPAPVDYFAYAAEECTKTLEVECAFDIEKTVVACSKAFETGGADIIADIKCTKDLLSDKKHCWPCICAEAKKKGWHVVGC